VGRFSINFSGQCGPLSDNKNILKGNCTAWFNFHNELNGPTDRPTRRTKLHLFKNFPIFYGTWRFNTMFTRACHKSRSWARWIQSTPPHYISLRLIFILSSTYI
jgi:hypothetical protein